MLKRPSPSLGISMLALLISLGGAAFSANGGSFILGQANSATAKTSLVAPVAGPALKVENTSTADGALGINIITAATQPPLAVNSSVKVESLNADLVDGIDSANIATRRVIKFDLLGGANSEEIGLPTDRAIHVAGAVNNGDVGQVTVFRDGNNLKYIAIQTHECGSCFVGGTAGEAGAQLLDINGNVQVEHGAAIGSLRVHNSGIGRRTGYVTLLW